MFHLTRGREISGYEKLLLSGIPADSLLLGGESEVQLSDLAGNAMSMPVVSASMLAALCILPYANRKANGSQHLDKDKKVDDPITGKKNAKQTYKAKLTLPSPADAGPATAAPSKAAAAKKTAAQNAVGRPQPAAGGGSALGDAFKPFNFASRACMAFRAECCSVLCTCESSGDVSGYAVSRCVCCNLTVCALCAAQVQLETHDMVTIHASCSDRFKKHGEHSAPGGDDYAAEPAELERELRRSVPDALRFATPVDGVGVDVFRLARVERGRGIFMLRYVQYHPTEGTASAVLSVSVGRLEAHGSHGLKAVLFDLCTGQRGPLEPVARLCVPHPSAAHGAAAGSAALSSAPSGGVSWETRDPCEATLEFEAVAEAGVAPSFRAAMGLIDFKDECWPQQVRVGGNGAGLVAGTYQRENCRGSIAFGALWKRLPEAGSACGDMWLFVDPSVDRTASDRLCFATTPRYLDGRGHHVAEVLLPEEEPVLEWLHELGQRAKRAPAAGASSVKGAAKGQAAGKKQRAGGAGMAGGAVTVVARLLQWTKQTWITLHEPTGGPTVCQQPPPPPQEPDEPQASGKAGAKGSKGANSSASDGASDGAFPSFTVSGLPISTLEKLREKSDGGRLSILSASSTVAERRLAESLAAPLLRYNLPTVVGRASRPAGAPAWGECEESAPRRPPERWSAEGKRTYETEDSNTYEKAMSERPPAWDVCIGEGAGKSGEGASKSGKGSKAGGGGDQSVVVVRPQVHVAAHQAAEKLLRRRGLDEATKSKLQVDCAIGARLDATRAVPVFPIPSSKADAASEQPPALAWDQKLRLYPRQLQVKAWMQDIEEGNVLFDEYEATDAALPSVGWTLQAKAKISAPLRGGVLADALGAGKTVTVIALIAADVERARALKLSASGSQRHLSRASLIVVTPLIIRQWEAEIERFSAGKLRCVRIESAAQLQALTAKLLREADVVLVVSDLLGCAGKAVKYAKAVDVAPEQQTSKEAEKESVRAMQRFEDMGIKDKAQVQKLAKSLDERKDTYLNLLTTAAGTEELPPFLHRRNQNRESGVGDAETTIYGVWLSASSRDPFGKVKGRQEDREAAAFYTHSYTRVALPALRAKTFKETDKGVPIEYFRWRRVIVDECHEPLCMGTDDAEEAAVSSKRSSCAVRELLGIAIADVESRPLLAQRGTFGLTGTPLLSSVARITELASLCAGTCTRHTLGVEQSNGCALSPLLGAWPHSRPSPTLAHR